ncbi:hypothetical protein O181_013134 [Austropuccinia psidii MF-1]|uniref:Uncharacterized protein n=1 Tax=Austropuccinia psidii MF-1 TaxID=1389203 RepID=A0A9Q3BXL7_9BASI|nr:hypothetical protein [Austropuccinia psidii MF-1]
MACANAWATPILMIRTHIRLFQKRSDGAPLPRPSRSNGDSVVWCPPPPRCPSALGVALPRIPTAQPLQAVDPTEASHSSSSSYSSWTQATKHKPNSLGLYMSLEGPALEEASFKYESNSWTTLHGPLFVTSKELFVKAIFSPFLNVNGRLVVCDNLKSMLGCCPMRILHSFASVNGFSRCSLLPASYSFCHFQDHVCNNIPYLIAIFLSTHNLHLPQPTSPHLEFHA